ncbi:MAG TPA: LCP family protein [Clostridiales bacterium]|nr:LCP family protein [Clostridiales bacterium]
MSKQLSKKKKMVLWTLLVVTSLLLIVSLTAYIYLQSMLNLINRPDNSYPIVNPEDEFFETDEDAEGDEIDPNDILWPEDDYGVIRDKNIINILLIGQDRRPGESRARSDSMIIATINKKNGTIKLTSLMRDLYVQIPGYSDNRINAAYAFGGMKLLNEVIEKNFKIHIDGNIEVDFEGFVKGIDIIGGITLSLSEKEAEHLNKKGFSNVKAGEVNMDGELALEYARIRKIGNDFARTERQRKVILAVAKKVKGSGISDLMALANKVLPCVTTDMSNDQLMDLIFTAAKSDLSNIEQNRIPRNGSYKDAKIRGMLVLVPDLVKVREDLKNIIYGD